MKNFALVLSFVLSLFLLASCQSGVDNNLVDDFPGIEEEIDDSADSLDSMSDDTDILDEDVVTDDDLNSVDFGEEGVGEEVVSDEELDAMLEDLDSLNTDLEELDVDSELDLEELDFS